MPNPSDNICVRLATVADVTGLCELLVLLFAQEADFKPDAERQARGLRLIIGQPEVGRIYYATNEDRIVGMVNILFTVSTAEGGRAAWLEDMVVHRPGAGGASARSCCVQPSARHGRRAVVGSRCSRTPPTVRPCGSTDGLALCVRGWFLSA